MLYQECTLGWYESNAHRTASKDGEDLPPLWYLALGLNGEAGEVADLVKKVERHGHAYDGAAVIDELGDVLWYVTIMAAAVGSSLGEVAVANVNKLARRYPEGFRERGRDGLTDPSEP